MVYESHQDSIMTKSVISFLVSSTLFDCIFQNILPVYFTLLKLNLLKFLFELYDSSVYVALCFLSVLLPVFAVTTKKPRVFLGAVTPVVSF